MAICMLCADFECGCHILPQTTIYSINHKAKAFNVAEKPEIENNVNTFILIGKNNDGLLGQSCFDALCSAIKQAELQAQQYRKDNDYTPPDPNAEFWKYLPENWYKLLKNSHFQNMYACYMVYYYYYLGYADAATTLSGDINNKIQRSDLNDTGGDNITIEDASKKAAQHYGIAKGHYDAFVNTFWLKNQNLYNCGIVGKCKPIDEVGKHNGKTPFKPLPTWK